jgi:predicted N-formylglutamate amidohydrolase
MFPAELTMKRPPSLPSPTALAPPAEHPVEVIAGDLATGVLVLCDHASNTIPADYHALGMPAAELERHIAYDIGAAPLARRLAMRLGAPAVLTNFSRLLIDPNRGTDDPTLVMRLSDGAIVPGNARIDAGEVERRIVRFYRPYDAAITATIEAFFARGIAPVILSVHSFTPVRRGWPRPWQVGILWDADPRLAVPFIEALRAEGDLTVGDNEPYDGALRGDVAFRHATVRGLANALIEVRQDLIADDAGASAWGDRLAKVVLPLLGPVIRSGPRLYPSRTDRRSSVAAATVRNR